MTGSGCASGSRASTGSTPVAVALGSNIGDREAHLDYAVDRLHDWLSELRVSPFVDTEPVGVAPQGRFLNAVAVGRTSLDARSLLDTLLSIEMDRGRRRRGPHDGRPRTLDLDLILFGDQIVISPGLEVPHPRFRDRPFVLEPLASIAAQMVDPVSGLTVEELLKRLERGRA